MTVRMPGEECLTKTQEAQRAFREKFLEKSQKAETTTKVAGLDETPTVNGQMTSNPVRAAVQPDVSLVVPEKRFSSGTSLDLTV